MIFAISLLLGVCATATRSVASVILVAILIACTFAVALVTSGGEASLVDLAFAILGYNSGIISLFARGIFARA